MIELVTRRRISGRRDAVYKYILDNIHALSVTRLEHLMRRIHILNLKLKSYDTIPQKEPEEVFKEE